MFFLKKPSLVGSWSFLNFLQMVWVPLTDHMELSTLPETVKHNGILLSHQKLTLGT